MRSWAILVSVLFSGPFTTLAYAQAPIPGPEFQVNTPSPGSTRPVVAMDKKEPFVVAWNTDDPGIPIYQILGQQLDGSGMKLDSQFQVYTYTIGASYVAAIAMTGSILTLGSLGVCR